MSAEYVVTRAKNAGTKPNPHGGLFVKWYVGLKSDTEDHPDCYWQRKEGNEVTVGDKVYGSVSQGDYGPRFKAEQRPDNSDVNRSVAFSTPAPQTPAQGFSGGDDRSRRIERQHAMKCAVELVQFLMTPETAAAKPDLVRAALKVWTDFFAADVDNASPQSAPSTAHSSPPQTGNGGAVDEAAPPAPSAEEVNALGLSYEDDRF